jgi:hypothetical protein
MAPLDQIDQIQDLVAEIDGVLRNDDRPWILGGRVRQRQRQTLEHLRSALTRLGGDLRQQATTSITNLSAANLSAANLSTTTLSEPALPGQPPRLKSSAITYGAAQTAIDTFTQDLQTLRTTLLQSLQTEVTSLQEQRDQLRREIQEMQRQPGQPGQTLLTEGMMQAFLQQLMLQLQERLSQQVQQSMAQQLATSQIPIGQARAIQSGDVTTLVPIDQAQLQFAQIQHLHDQSETLVRQVDSTLTVFAQTLEQNMQTYQQALEKGLEKMHSMGQQGEVLFAEFVNRLADRLEAQASAYFLANEGIAHEGIAHEGMAKAELANGALATNAIGPSQPAAKIGEPMAIAPGMASPIPFNPNVFNVELGNIDLGPGVPPALVQPDAPGPIAMDLTDGTPVFPQSDAPTAALTEVNWQAVEPSQPPAALDVAAAVRPTASVVDPEPIPTPSSEATPPEAPAEALAEPLGMGLSPVSRSAPTPANELDAFYADLMILTGGMSVTDRLIAAPIASSADMPADGPADAPLPANDSPEIAPAKRGSVDQEPIAQPPAPIAPAADPANVVQSLTELFDDSRSVHPSETDSTFDSALDSSLFAQYSVTGPADAQKKNRM